MAYKPIEDYGVIGDLYTVALVGLDGAIDFMCFPHFDSPSVFAALLDRKRGGSFRIGPTATPERRHQFYLPDTNVLLTRSLSREGVAELSDFMPVEEAGRAHNLVRRMKTVRGAMRYRMVCDPRFDYGRADHRVEQSGREVVFESQGPDRTALRLRSEVPLSVADGAAVAEFELAAGEHASFVLEVAEEGKASPAEHAEYVPTVFKNTVNFWRDWIGQATYRGRWQEEIFRSALILKLLVSREHGSIVAAPTFGLPEQVGGERNWDYRYTWIRDSAFTLYAFGRLGLHDESRAFFEWLERVCQEGGVHGPLQIMYGLDGRRRLEEVVLEHFEGYRGSRPVRVGNAAYGQLQLDIYGELMDSVYLFDKYGEPVHYDLWQRLVRLVDWVCENWQQPDEGIWEVRGGSREFVYSRVMCWVAIDRALRLARRRSLPAPYGRWLETRDRIYQDVYAHFWSPSRQAFVQHRGAESTDAATLIMPLVRFISPTDRRWLATLKAIEADLVEDSLVYRYRPEKAADDGLAGEEGTFSICTFWYVECLSRAGNLGKARFVFDKMLGHANHLGLYAEELGSCGEHLGNFPQAFTHLALISAAYDLNRRLSAAGERG